MQIWYSDAYKAGYEKGYAKARKELERQVLVTSDGKIHPIDVQSKRGKWINVNEGKWNTYEVLKCSVCGEMDNRMTRADNYCPNCGARMDGGVSE